MDTDGSGTLDKEEMQLALAALGRLSVPKQFDAVWAKVDRNGDGEVSFAECGMPCHNIHARKPEHTRGNPHVFV